MIRSFADEETEHLFFTGRSRRFGSILKVARRKLQVLDNTNRLEALKGDRKGQYSIRINDQFRMCFTWRDSEPHDVQIIDYH